MIRPAVASLSALTVGVSAQILILRAYSVLTPSTRNHTPSVAPSSLLPRSIWMDQLIRGPTRSARSARIPRSCPGWATIRNACLSCPNGKGRSTCFTGIGMRTGLGLKTRNGGIALNTRVGVEARVGAKTCNGSCARKALQRGQPT